MVAGCRFYVVTRVLVCLKLRTWLLFKYLAQLFARELLQLFRFFVYFCCRHLLNETVILSFMRLLFSLLDFLKLLDYLYLLLNFLNAAFRALLNFIIRLLTRLWLLQILLALRARRLWLFSLWHSNIFLFWSENIIFVASLVLELHYLSFSFLSRLNICDLLGKLFQVL